METDASSAGVKRGGLVNKAEIKILICYVFDSVAQPICGRNLAELLHHEGIANYFEVDEAIEQLRQSGSIVLVDGNVDKYVITPSGSDAATTLKTSVPYTIRQKAYSATIKMLAAARNYEETEFKVEERDKGCIVSCSAFDHELELLTIRLLVADEQQAKTVKDRFVANPGAVCRKIINFLMENENE